jgi:hypothetical protein
VLGVFLGLFLAILLAELSCGRSLSILKPGALNSTFVDPDLILCIRISATFRL